MQRGSCAMRRTARKETLSGRHLVGRASLGPAGRISAQVAGPLGATNLLSEGSCARFAGADGSGSHGRARVIMGSIGKWVRKEPPIANPAELGNRLFIALTALGIHKRASAKQPLSKRMT